MANKTQIKQEILLKTKEFYQSEKIKNAFIPGKTAIAYAGRMYDDKELRSLISASLDFWLTAGAFAHAFESQLAKFLNMKFCLLTNSGSSANLLAVAALASLTLGNKRLKVKDEVITVSCGFPTTLNPLLQYGLIPVFIDIRLGTYTIDARQIEKAINGKTKAIFVAHTLGNPAELGLISKIAKKYNVWLIEDNCDALGSCYKGRRTGSFGDISTCSFYPAHHITTGEGGAVLTNNPLLKRVMMSLRDWGRDCYCEPGYDNTCKKRFNKKFGDLPYGYDHKYVYSQIGYNLKITDLQAAIGVAQLKKLPRFIEMRKSNFRFLYKVFEPYEQYFLLPRGERDSDPSWFGFPVLVRKTAPFTRATIVAYLESHKISTRMLFGGNLIRQPAYRQMKYRAPGGLKNTDLVMNNLFWLGVHPGLTEPMLSYIKKTVDIFFRQAR